MQTIAPYILIVDDEPEIRELNGRAFAAHGLCCDTAANGVEALELAKSTSYSAVITDLRMPIRHGSALCDDLLRLPKPPPILVCTGLNEPRLARDLVKRGVREVLVKPIDYENLAGKVKQIVGETGRQESQGAAQASHINSGKFGRLAKIEFNLMVLTQKTAGRLDAAFDLAGDLPSPPRSIRGFIHRLAATEEAQGRLPGGALVPAHAERKIERVTCFTTAVAVPVDCYGNPAGEAFKLALRDLSESGVRLLHSRATNAKYLALRWNATQDFTNRIGVMCQVRRCQPLGPFYDLGLQFVLPEGIDAGTDAPS